MHKITSFFVTFIPKGLIAIHNLAVREHNRIAKELKLINQEWNEEKLFYETRKIVAALHQHITYNEYLPEILDENIVSITEKNTGNTINILFFLFYYLFFLLQAGHKQVTLLTLR